MAFPLRQAMLILNLSARHLFGTEVLVFVGELDESRGDLWYRHREGQGVREARVDQKRRATAEVDERFSWPSDHAQHVFFRR